MKAATWCVVGAVSLADVGEPLLHLGHGSVQMLGERSEDVVLCAGGGLQVAVVMDGLFARIESPQQRSRLVFLKDTTMPVRSTRPAARRATQQHWYMDFGTLTHLGPNGN